MNTILAVETSCDDTAAAIVRDGINVLGCALHSQIPDHHKYGGIVPEIASRKHIENIIKVIELALQQAFLSTENRPHPEGEDGVDFHSNMCQFLELNVAFKGIEAIAVTIGPGLIGSLLIGLSVAKAMAFALDIPIIPVDHLEGHIYASLLTCPGIRFPFVCLVVSGGHTDIYFVNGHGDYKLLGQTRDDAAGEAFDKVAKVLGLGYPGGPLIDKLSTRGDPAKINFPRAYLEKGSLDFSFSGLKTAVYNYVKFEKGRYMENRQPESDSKEKEFLSHYDQEWMASVSASFQEAVIDVLVSKVMDAIALTGAKTLALGGGVASNSRLRERLRYICKEEGIILVIPSPHLCVDNASMIGAAGFFNQTRATKDWSITAQDSRVIRGI